MHIDISNICAVEDFYKVNYSPLICVFCGKAANNRIKKLHKRELRVLHYNYTATFEDLLEKSKEVTVHCSSLQKLMIEIYEYTNYIGPAILTEFFTAKGISYDLRIKICSRYQKYKPPRMDKALFHLEVVYFGTLCQTA